MKYLKYFFITLIFLYYGIMIGASRQYDYVNLTLVLILITVTVVILGLLLYSYMLILEENRKAEE